MLCVIRVKPAYVELTVRDCNILSAGGVKADFSSDKNLFLSDINKFLSDINDVFCDNAVTD